MDLNVIATRTGAKSCYWLSLRGSLIKILRVMKLTAIILLAVCLQASATGFSQTISFKGENVPLKQFFSAIEKQSAYIFFYKTGLLDNTKPITLNVKDIAIEAAVKEALRNQPLDYVIEDKTILIKAKAPVKIEDDIITGTLLLPIRGTVKDADGRPLAGASISVKGSKEAVISNEKGNFEINAKEGDVLVISYVGFERQELKVGKEGTISFVLKNKIVNIDSVTIISTGYEKISKERFVGSYAQLDSANFHRRVGMGIIERLDGTVPGVLFDKKGGFPIQIRGISTIGASSRSEPLVVIDNFPILDVSVQVENLNPNDVESITVLKDAAATSIWGAQAGNGVIVITTKRGKYNQRFQLSASSNVTVEEKPDLYYYPKISSSDAINIEEFLFSKGFYDANINNNTNRPVISQVVEILARRRANLLTDADTAAQIGALRQHDVRSDLNKYVYREAIRQQHYMGFNGGNNVLAYQFSFGYNHSLNNIQGSKPDGQYTITTNTSFRPVKNLDIQAGINFTQNIVKSVGLPFSSFSPYASLVDANGNALAVPNQYRQGYIDTAGGGKLLDWNYRPLDEIRLTDATTNSKAINLNLNVGYKLTSWLQANISYQYNNLLSASRNYKSLQVYETRDLINQYTNFNQTNDNLRYPVPKGGILNVFNSLFKSYFTRGTLNFNKSFGIDHQLTALLGGEINNAAGGYSTSQRFYGYNDLVGTYRMNVDYNTFFARPYPKGSLSATIPLSANYTEQDSRRLVSVLGNISYTYKSRYNFYASARRDGANVFGVNTNNKWKPLWSAGAGWDVSKESFYHVSWMPFFKLRASYGYTGNVARNNVAGILTIRIGGPDIYSNLPFNSISDAPNKNLRWEQVRIINAGADFGLFQNRLSGSLEVFMKRSTDVITGFPLAPTSGVNSIPSNAGDLKATGFELNLNAVNIKGPIEWSSNFSLSYAKTVVAKIYNVSGYAASDFITYGLNAATGRIAFGLSSYRWAGLDPNTGDPQGYLDGQVSKNYQRIFSDSIQNQVFNGSALPLYSGFLRNNFSWKGFTLSANITGRFKYYFREPALELSYTSASNPNGVMYAADYYQRWQKPGDEAFTNIPSMPYPVGTNVSARNTFYSSSEILVKRADNIRLQDVRLSYQWYNKKAKNILFKSVQFFFYPNNLNLILWRAEDSQYDPDFTGSSGNLVPTPRTWTGGVTLNF